MKIVIDFYDAAVREYERSFKLTDDILYKLCRDHPGHSSRLEVAAKCYLIGRTYATGIERAISSKSRASMEVLVNHLLEHSADVSNALGIVSGLHEPLTTSNLARVVKAHSKLNGLVMKITREKQSARSFASKYLHFHQPVVPIYDSRAAKAIPSRVRWSDKLRAFEPDKVVDEEYFRYCCRFLKLCQILQDGGRHPKAILVDKLLLYSGSVRDG